MDHQDEVRRFLQSKGWPPGLISTLLARQCSIPGLSSRFFLCDDSTSMQSEDGEVVVDKDGNKVVEECTRWDELRHTIQAHSYLSSLGQFRTEYRLLNAGIPMVIGATREQDAISMPAFDALLTGVPTGGTPLCYHIDEVVRQITAAAPELRRNGQKAALLILTDGEASDGNIEEHMKPLCNLPCMVVVRLCTNQQEIIEYWDSLIDKLELYMDVIDDPMTEAAEVNEFNDWFTYGEPLHRLREFGVPVKEYFAMDYKKFSHEQMKALIALLFGLELSTVPSPTKQWPAFLAMVNNINNTTGIIPASNQPSSFLLNPTQSAPLTITTLSTNPLQYHQPHTHPLLNTSGAVVWNPITKQNEKWIIMDKLIEGYSPDPANDHLGTPPSLQTHITHIHTHIHTSQPPHPPPTHTHPQPPPSPPLTHTYIHTHTHLSLPNLTTYLLTQSPAH